MMRMDGAVSVWWEKLGEGGGNLAGRIVVRIGEPEIVEGNEHTA